MIKMRSENLRQKKGVVFEGEFQEDVFHGQGSLEWPQKQRIEGRWFHGELQEKQFFFSDGLIFQEENWDYCKFPDRRFFPCVKNGLNPAGKTLKTAKQPTPIINSSFYDTGDGVFNPNSFSVTSYNLKRLIRIPKEEDSEWIVKNCRKGSPNFTGYREDLNENWSQEPPNLPYSLPFSNDSPQSWWRRLSTFERDVEVKTGNEKPVPRGENISEESCLCYKSTSPDETLLDSHSIISKDRSCSDNKKSEFDIENREKASIVNVLVSERESQSTLEGKFQGYSSDEIFDEEMREIERTRVVHDSSRSSLDENKLDVEDDEQPGKKQIKKTEKAKKEPGELMIKTKEEEVLKDSSKQEISQKDKEASSAEKQEVSELNGGLMGEKKGMKVNGYEESEYGEDRIGRAQEIEEHEELEKNKEAKEIETNTKTGEMEANEEAEKMETSEETGRNKEVEEIETNKKTGEIEANKEAKKMETSEETKETGRNKEVEEIETNKKTGEVEANEKAKKIETSEETKKTGKNEEVEEMDRSKETKETGKNEEAEDMITSKETKKIKRYEEAEEIETEETKTNKGIEKIETKEKAKEINRNRDAKERERSKEIEEININKKAARKKKISLNSKEEINRDKLTNLKDKLIGIKYSESENEIENEENIDEIEVIFKKSHLIEENKTEDNELVGNNKSDETLEEIKEDKLKSKFTKVEKTSKKSGYFGTCVIPKANFDSKKETCDPNICLKNATRGCVQYTGQYAAPCKPRKAIDLVHLRIRNTKSTL